MKKKKNIYFFIFSAQLAFRPNVEPDVSEIRIHEGQPLEIKCMGFLNLQFHYPKTGAVRSTIYILKCATIRKKKKKSLNPKDFADL